MDTRPVGGRLLQLQVELSESVWRGRGSTSPDPSDFHDFTDTNLYVAGANMYRGADGSATPIMRDKSKVMATMQQFAQLEQVLGAVWRGRMESFDWVFSPKVGQRCTSADVRPDDRSSGPGGGELLARPLRPGERGGDQLGCAGSDADGPDSPDSWGRRIRFYLNQSAKLLEARFAGAWERSRTLPTSTGGRTLTCTEWGKIGADCSTRLARRCTRWLVPGK